MLQISVCLLETSSIDCQSMAWHSNSGSKLSFEVSELIRTTSLSRLLWFIRAEAAVVEDWFQSDSRRQGLSEELLAKEFIVICLICPQNQDRCFVGGSCDFRHVVPSGRHQFQIIVRCMLAGWTRILRKDIRRFGTCTWTSADFGGQRFID